MDIHIDVRCECFSTLAATIEYDSALDELVAIVTPCSACHVAAIEKLEAELEEALKLKDQFSDALAKKFDATVMPIWNELKAKLDKLRTEREKLRKALEKMRTDVAFMQQASMTTTGERIWKHAGNMVKHILDDTPELLEKSNGGN